MHSALNHLLPLILLAIVFVSWIQSYESEKFLRLLIKVFPKCSTAHLRLGMLLKDKPEQLDEAEKEIRQAITLDPRFRDSYYRLSALLWNKENWETEIQTLCNTLFERFPEDPFAYLIFGYLQERRESYAEAEQAYRSAISCAPLFTEAYHYLINLMIRTKKFEEARQVYALGSGVLPKNDGKYQLVLGYNYHLNEEYQEASCAYQKVIQQDPDHIDAYLNLALLQYEKLDQAEEAEKNYRRVIQLAPLDPYPYFQLGLLSHMHFHRLDEAEEMYHRVLEIDPHDETALYNLACVKAINNDVESAIAFLEKAIREGIEASDAWDDPDFDSMKGDPRFLDLVGPRT